MLSQTLELIFQLLSADIKYFMYSTLKCTAKNIVHSPALSMRSGISKLILSAPSEKRMEMCRVDPTEIQIRANSRQPTQIY